MADESKKEVDSGERVSQITFAQDALKGIVLTNGGAVIALLAFIGQAWGRSGPQAIALVEAIRAGMTMFLVGTSCGITAQGLAYVAQLSFGLEHVKRGQALRAACLAFGLAGIGLFGWGSLATLDGVLSLKLKGI